jgi:peptidoglycan/LPS O-acetylase OafA/YrhL
MPTTLQFREQAMETGARPPDSIHRLLWLDGLRGYAIGGVLLVHVSLIAYANPHGGFDRAMAKLCALGQYGVQLFFVISAVTAYYTLGQRPVSLAGCRAWFIKRYLRIAPLYYTAIPTFYLFGSLSNWARGKAHKPPMEIFTVQDAIKNVLFLHEWSRHGNNNVVRGGWSIGVEMMFYVLAPLLFAMLRRRHGLLFLAISAVGSLVLARLCFGSGIKNNSFAYFSFPEQLPVLLCGLALCKLTGGWLFSGDPVPRRATILAFCLAVPSLCFGAFCGVAGDEIMP